MESNPVEFTQEYSEEYTMTFADFGHAWNWVCKRLDHANDNNLKVCSISLMNFSESYGYDRESYSATVKLEIINAGV